MSSKSPRASSPSTLEPERPGTGRTSGAQLTPRVALREVREGDLAALYEHQRDPEAARMAAFASRDAAAFQQHWEKVLANPAMFTRVIVLDDGVVGNIGSWSSEGKRLVGYWIDRAYWGRGIATAALCSFLSELRERPLHAFVALHNVGSARVLEKCGFVLLQEWSDGDVPEREYVLR